MFSGSAVPRLLQPEPRSHTGKGVDLWEACRTAAEDNEPSDESHALTVGGLALVGGIVLVVAGRKET